ncbi:putative ABC transporter permease subunit [Halobacillus campisalis]|uniref:ABC transporter permease n=1 Tax=Halobacillus campisalis TaxID=435909 RepID=A0ABW2K1Z1_9BACI|nr:ABC transporter permease [Halobacillus campisalis]
MNKTWKLIRTIVKMQFSLAGKSTSEQIGYAFLFIFAIPFSIFIFYAINGIVGGLYTILEPAGNESFILGLLFISMFVVLILVSVGSILSSFYFAEDIESFLSLPYHPFQIMLGKSAVPFITLYVTNAAILAPGLIVFGLHSGSGVLYYIYALILWTVTPVLPFVLTAIIVMYGMRFLNLSKNKDRMKIFAGLFTFIFIIGINIVLRTNNSSADTGEDLARLIQEQNGLLNTITTFFPTAYLHSISLTDPASARGFLFLVLSLLIIACAFALYLTAGQKIYFKGVLGLSGGSKKKFDEEKITKRIKQSNVLFISWVREMRTIFRTPTFFTQIIVQSLVFPVLFIVVILFDSSGGDFSISSLGAMVEEIEPKRFILAMTGFTVFALGINPASISSVSRDGKSWFNHLYMPIKAETVIMSKVWAAFCINLLTLLVIGAVAFIFVNIPIGIGVIWFGLSLIINWITSVAGTTLDLYTPNLQWTDEREVFKGRLIGILALIIEVVVFGSIILFLWNVDWLEGLWMTSSILTAAFILLSFVCHLILRKVIRTQYYSIHQ